MLNFCVFKLCLERCGIIVVVDCGVELWVWCCVWLICVDNVCFELCVVGLTLCIVFRVWCPLLVCCSFCVGVVVCSIVCVCVFDY